MNGKCPMRPKKYFFGLFNGYDHHDVEITMISKWAFGKWEMTIKCKSCGAEREVFALTDEDLLWEGLPLDEIKKACKDDYWWRPKKAEVKS